MTEEQLKDRIIELLLYAYELDSKCMLANKDLKIAENGDSMANATRARAHYHTQMAEFCTLHVDLRSSAMMLRDLRSGNGPK